MPTFCNVCRHCLYCCAIYAFTACSIFLLHQLCYFRAHLKHSCHFSRLVYHATVIMLGFQFQSLSCSLKCIRRDGSFLQDETKGGPLPDDGAVGGQRWSAPPNLSERRTWRTSSTCRPGNFAGPRHFTNAAGWAASAPLAPLPHFAVSAHFWKSDRCLLIKSTI